MLKRGCLAGAIGVVLLLLLPGCPLPIPKPAPPSPPVPPPEAPPSPACVDGQTHSCWHLRPGEDWLYACPVYDAAGAIVGVRNVTDRAACPGEPEPPEPPVDPPPVDPPGPEAPPLIPDEELVADPTDTRKLTFQLTHEAVGRWRAKHPERWRADGACLVDGVAGIDAAFLAVARELRAVGVVAGQSIKRDGKRSDAIFVNELGTKRYEETHLFDYSRACVATSAGAIKFTYVRRAHVSLCTDPQPPPLHEIGLRCDRPGKWPCDGTPKVFGFEYRGPGTNYCRDIGLGEMPGQPGVERRICPAGNEDNGPRRAACERVVLGLPGPPAPALWRSDGAVEVNPDNHLLARCSSCSWIEVCKADGTKCTRVAP